MAREPNNPAEEPIAKAEAPETASGETAPEKPANAKLNRKIVTGAAIGIGSAALVAALLYANRSRKGGNGERS